MPDFDKKEDFLIDFYDKFGRSREYVKDGRFEIREAKIKKLYKIYKKEKLTKKEIFRKIAREVSYILPTTHNVVQKVVYAKQKKLS